MVLIIVVLSIVSIRVMNVEIHMWNCVLYCVCRAIRGSVSDYCARNAMCPVVVVNKKVSEKIEMSHLDSIF